MNCAKCGSTHTTRDEADIGVGIMYGPWWCEDCGWIEDHSHLLGSISIDAQPPIECPAGADWREP